MKGGEQWWNEMVVNQDHDKGKIDQCTKKSFSCFILSERGNKTFRKVETA